MDTSLHFLPYLHSHSVWLCRLCTAQLWEHSKHRLQCEWCSLGLFSTVALHSFFCLMGLFSSDHTGLFIILQPHSVVSLLCWCWSPLAEIPFPLILPMEVILILKGLDYMSFFSSWKFLGFTIQKLCCL